MKAPFFARKSFTEKGRGAIPTSRTWRIQATVNPFQAMKFKIILKIGRVKVVISNY